MPKPTLLLTRPDPDSTRFLAAVGARVAGFDSIVSPLLRIEPRGPLPKVESGGGAIFTSRNGVAAWQALGGAPLPLCFAVGDATARAARAAGFDPISAQGNADALVALIRARPPGGPLVHLRGVHARGNIAGRLCESGIPTTEAVIYDQPAQELSGSAKAALAGAGPVILPLFSPRSAQQVARGAPFSAPLFVAAMSAEVAEALGALYVQQLEIPDRPDAEHMQDVVIGLLKDRGALVKGHGSVKG